VPTAALADAAFILGHIVWEIRRILLRRPNDAPPYFLWDFVRNSVLTTGFRLRPVENPAITGAAANDPTK